MGGEFDATINFVRSLPTQRHVRSMLVVPIENRHAFGSEVLLPKRDQDQQPQKFFERSVKPFDNCDAAVLADRSEPRLDLFPFAPCFVALVPELWSFVADDVFGSDLRRLHGSS